METLTKEAKALTRWLNNYAFTGWILTEHAEISVMELIRLSEEDGEEFQELLEEFMQAKLEVVKKAGEDNE